MGPCPTSLSKVCSNIVLILSHPLPIPVQAFGLCKVTRSKLPNVKEGEQQVLFSSKMWVEILLIPWRSTCQYGSPRDLWQRKSNGRFSPGSVFQSDAWLVNLSTRSHSFCKADQRDGWHRNRTPTSWPRMIFRTSSFGTKMAWVHNCWRVSWRPARLPPLQVDVADGSLSFLASCLWFGLGPDLEVSKLIFGVVETACFTLEKSAFPWTEFYVSKIVSFVTENIWAAQQDLSPLPNWQQLPGEPGCSGV